MPSSTKKQADFMKAVANNPKFAKKAGVPQKVGKDFASADKRTKKFAVGGMANGGDYTPPSGAYQFPTGPTVAQTNTMPAEQPNTINVGGDALGNQFPRLGFKKGGITKSGGGMKESKKMVGKELAFMKKKGAPKSMIKHEMKEAGVKKMAKGGLAAGHKSADGIASKGKTKAKQVKMAYGGKC